MKPRRQHCAIDMNFIEGMRYQPPASLYMLMMDSCRGERTVPSGRRNCRSRSRRREEPVGRPLFERQTEGIVRFKGAALHPEHRVEVVRVNGAVNRIELQRAHDPVDAPVDAADVGDDAAGERLREDDREKAPEGHAEERESNVDALLAGLHVEPHLKDVVRDENEGGREDRDHDPGPALLFPEADAAEEGLG
mgnify:CR=1 FL=1